MLQLTDELRDHNCYHHLVVYINRSMSHDQRFEASLEIMKSYGLLEKEREREIERDRER